MIDPAQYGSQNYNAVESRTAGYVPVFGVKKGAAAPADFGQMVKDAAPANSAPESRKEEHGGFLSFIFGLLDVINPLQHIPVISTIYRHLTGDEIGPVARVAGDTLYGGPVGGVLGLADVALEGATGKDMGETAMALLLPGAVKDNGTRLAGNYNGIEPAAGTLSKADIIWNEPTKTARQDSGQDSGPLSTPLRYTGAVPEDREGQKTAFDVLTAAKADSTTLPSQEAPAEASRMDAPPELIAARMMAALDKYQAMKRLGLNSR
jgi:hypothetical protein